MSGAIICLLLALYLIMGAGVYSMAKCYEKETPMHVISLFVLWPALLLLTSIGFLFTGKRYND